MKEREDEGVFCNDRVRLVFLQGRGPLPPPPEYYSRSILIRQPLPFWNGMEAHRLSILVEHMHENPSEGEALSSAIYVYVSQE